MEEDLKGQKQVDAMMVHALERRPEIAIPQDFAARVSLSLPEKEPVRAKARPVFGYMAGYVAIAAMMAALVSLTWKHPEALEAGRGFVFVVELLLIAQLLAVGLWLGIKNDGPG